MQRCLDTHLAYPISSAHKVHYHALEPEPCFFKGSRAYLQISSNITKLCKDEKYTTMMLYMKSYSCRL